MEALLVVVLSALLVGTVADVWYYVLIKPDHVLGFVDRFVNRIRDGITDPEKRDWFDYLMKPIVGCNRCIAGQMALWVYLFGPFGYNLFQHIAFICLAIFWATLFERVFE